MKRYSEEPHGDIVIWSSFDEGLASAEECISLAKQANAAIELAEALETLLKWPALINCVDTRVTQAHEAMKNIGALA